MSLGRLWYTWDATETDIEQMRQDRSDNSLVWLLSRCWSAWKYDSNLGREALGIRTQQTFCATAWNLLFIEKKKIQNLKATELFLEKKTRLFNSLFGPCPLRLLLLTTGLYGDCVTFHDVIQPSAPSCTGAELCCTWLCCWFTSFVLRTASALKLNAIFTITVSGAFFQLRMQG